jgi:hypothetical protein
VDGAPWGRKNLKARLGRFGALGRELSRPQLVSTATAGKQKGSAEFPQTLD